MTAQESKALAKTGPGEIVKLEWADLRIRKSDANGAPVAFSAEVPLSFSRGELVLVEGNKAMVAAAGYYKLNRIAALTVLGPDCVNVDGSPRANPYIELDPATKAVTGVYVRKMAFGPSPSGSMCVTDSTLYFSVRGYFMQDLMKKIKDYPAGGALGTEKSRPGKTKYPVIEWKTTSKGKRYPEQNGEKEVDFTEKPMHFFPIQEGVGLWVDLSNMEIMGAFATHIQRQRFAERIAQTIATRNAMKIHPAIATQQVVVVIDPETKKPKFDTVGVTVFGWRHNLDLQGAKQIAADIERGKLPGVEHIVADATTGEIEADPEEEAGIIDAEEAGQHGIPSTGEPGTDAGDEPPPPEDAQAPQPAPKKPAPEAKPEGGFSAEAQNQIAIQECKEDMEQAIAETQIPQAEQDSIAATMGIPRPTTAGHYKALAHGFRAWAKRGQSTQQRPQNGTKIKK